MTNPTITTTEELLDYWPGNIPFKGQLISQDGTCMCAQGQALYFLGGVTTDELRRIEQAEADSRVAEIFDISLAHSILLRIVNDERQGAPTCVIRNPEQVIGDQAQTVLKFWRHLDRMTPAEWSKAGEMITAKWHSKIAVWKAAGESARKAGWGSWPWKQELDIGEDVRDRAATRDAAWAAAEEMGWIDGWRCGGGGVAAGAATCEIQGAAVLRANNQPFTFLPIFGLANPEEIQ